MDGRGPYPGQPVAVINEEQRSARSPTAGLCVGGRPQHPSIGYPDAVRITVDSQAFAAERARFALRFCCESCAYFFPRPFARCAHGWPQAEHRSAYYGPTAAPRGEVVFCKEFELG